MQLTKSEAAGALHDIESAQMRTAEMRSYHRAGPYLVLWGAIWALGYGLMDVRPPAHWGMIWLPLDTIGIAASIWLGLGAQAGQGAKRARRSTMRSMVGALFVGAFVVASFAIFAPVGLAPAIVYPGLIAGLVYGLCGLLWMPRLAWIGIAMFALSLIGFFLFQPWLLPWMAVVGGGGLMLGGLWLRTA